MTALNPQQHAAAEAGDGPVAIIAGPGTGKTKTLSARIAHLLQTDRAKPHDILALTFTKKAAEEMAARVSQTGVTICTFHSLCHSLLGGDYQFVTEPARLNILRSLPKTAATKGRSARELGLLISRAKNGVEEDEALSEIMTLYNAALAEQGVIDFDDLLVQAHKMLQTHPAKRPLYTHILVDEFQDTNLLQYKLLQLLRQSDNLFIIGDPNQSIYGFRGASGDIFTQFKADFPRCITIELTKNYRSAQPIVTLANAIFADAPQLQAASGAAGQVQAFQLLNEYSEAHWVVEQIEQALGGTNLLQATHEEARHGLSDFAILYRNRRVGKHVQKYIADSGLPYQIVGDGSPYERSDVQILVSILRRLAGQQVKAGDLSVNQIETLLQNIDKQQPVARIAARMADTFGFSGSGEVAHFIGTLVRFKNIQEAVTYFDYLQNNQFYDPTAQAITLLTIHASKGLEFPYVFLVGAEDGILPGDKADIQEEKRLFYVAVTRAKERLDVTHVTRRTGDIARPSQFITALPHGVLPQVKDPNLQDDLRRLRKRQAKKAQTTLF